MKAVFLTYPQCPFSAEDVVENIRMMTGPTYEIESYTASTERHATGDPHVHALIVFNKKFQSRGEARVFDIDGHHPNIQSCRSLKRVREYIKKDGIFIEDGWNDHGNKWGDFLKCESKKDFFEKIKSESPRDYILQMEKLEYAANKIFSTETVIFTSEFSPDSFFPTKVMQQWLEDMEKRVSRIFIGGQGPLEN